MSKIFEHDDWEPATLPIRSDEIESVLEEFRVSQYQVKGTQNYRYDDRKQHPKLTAP